MAEVAEAPYQEVIHAAAPGGWLARNWFSQDHKTIAIQYGATAIGVGLFAVALSGLMRLQLGFPGAFDFITPDAYTQFVTMHGMIMIVYLLTAILLGTYGNYLIPLMLGARDMVFPFLNMLSYHTYLLSVVLLFGSYFVPGGPTGAGWTMYPPAAVSPGTPGAGAGILMMLASLGVFVAAFTMGGLNYVTTVLQARTRGMTLMRMPLTVWGIFLATVLGLFAFPALLVAGVMMALDATIGTSFFMPASATHLGGGSPLLFQHLFWFFGHPEVYIVALPTFGIISDVLTAHARRAIFGYRMMVWATLAIAVLSFLVWAHHMYVSGMHPYFGFFFAVSTLIIAVPTAIKVYNWTLTLWRGDIHLTLPMLFSLAFLITFVVGGLSGALPRQRDRRCAALGHLLRRCPLPHGDGRRARARRHGGHLPLVPALDGPLPPRGPRPRPFLDHRGRHLRDLLPHALPWRAGDAAPLLRVPRLRLHPG